jgi:YrbI family 3-deoxy-D-manno-octulosonate 8-phosphate phosphatase
MRVLNLESLESIVFDFDGVLTDNRVWTDADGREMVACHRGDGLAFDVLRAMSMKVFILSTETNPVVARRAQKLCVPCLQSIGCKAEALRELSVEHQFSLGHTLFVGNDLNDLAAMDLCGYRACPADAHPVVRSRAHVVTGAVGGNGVVRELVEEHLGIDMDKALRKGACREEGRECL